ncbi:hypothetical protein [Yersinia rohdei]|nr:hypothetical protein [Yersinia rohdei]
MTTWFIPVNQVIGRHRLPNSLIDINVLGSLGYCLPVTQHL